MFGLSFWEIAIILAVALIILGPTKLPELAKTLDRGIREFRRATDDFKAQVDHEMMDEPDVEPAPALPNGKTAPAAVASEAEADVVPAPAPAPTSANDAGAAEAAEVAGVAPAKEAREGAPVEERKADA